MRAIRQTLAEAYYAQHGIEPPPMRPERMGFDVELDGSPLLQLMRRRLAETPDETGEALFRRLLACEETAKPVQEAAGKWLDAQGYPERDEWDEWDADTEWRSLRW